MMRKKTLILMATLLALILSGGFPCAPWAQTPPAITIDLAFDSNSFAWNQDIGATVTVTNSGPITYINQDFLSLPGEVPRKYYLDLTIWDPAGQLLVASRPAPATPEEIHSTQPLPFINVNGVAVQQGRGAAMNPGTWAASRANRLQDYYNIALPGVYRAKIQLSAMTFKDSTYNINDYAWQGILASAEKSFYYEGKTSVQISPATWDAGWKNMTTPPDVTATVCAATGESVTQYIDKCIYLNNVDSKTVVPASNCLTATFDGKRAVESLGASAQPGQYRARVAGWLDGGGFFGGARWVTLAAASGYSLSGFLSPVVNTPTENLAKAGAAIPLKWRVTDAGGAPVADASVFKLNVYPTTCNPSAPTDVIEEYVSAGASGLQYLGDGYWQYNWKTSKAWVGSCKKTEVSITANPTTKITAYFRFK
jgi:hypothetical protein